MSPRISYFYGISIYLNPYDHPPPHLHATHGEHEVSINIKTGEALGGVFPKNSMRILLRWLDSNRDDLLEAWEMSQKGVFVKIPPHRK